MGVGVTEVKKRIEALINKDYMHRSEDDRNLYHYQAWTKNNIILIQYIYIVKLINYYI